MQWWGFRVRTNGNMTVESRGGLRTTYTYDRENRVSVKNDIVRSRAAGWGIQQSCLTMEKDKEWQGSLVLL